MLYESIIAIIIHVIILIVIEFLIFIIYIVNTNSEKVYKSINNILQTEISYELRALLFSIFNLYNSYTLYEKANTEKTQVNNNNNIVIYIFVGISIGLFAILITILIILYKYKIALNWKKIIIIVLFSLSLISIFEASLILHIVFNYKINNYEVQVLLMKKLYNEYYNGTLSDDIINKYKIL
jgi:hypothetical protein